MRVNVSEAFISKTFMYGLKVSLQRQLTKSNKKSLEFYFKLKYKKIIKQTLVIAATQFLLKALKILIEFATFAKLIILQLQLTLPLYYQFINNFIYIISFNVFNRLTVLMNDLRLKTFHCKLIKPSKFIKSSRTTTTTKTASSYLARTGTGATATATAAASVFATTAVSVFKQKTNNNNNKHRTYNNSSKSNKVFLYYTPRDPHLRIFLKTKHFFNRPQQQTQTQTTTTFCYCFTAVSSSARKCSLKIFSDLCNYGELIGGGIQKIISDSKTISKQLNNFNLSYTQIKRICDNLIELKKSDNLIVATADGAAIIFMVVISAAITVISRYIQELLKLINILLSFHYDRLYFLKVLDVKSPSFGLYEIIL